MEEIISIAGVSVLRNQERPVLSDFHLHIGKGSLTVLFGAGGTGKTTLFRLLVGEMTSDAGEIRVGNLNLSTLRNAAMAEYRKSIGVIFQDVPLLADRTAEEQILLPMELAGMNSSRRHERIESILDRFQLRDIRSEHPDALSMGLRQRVAIARAVANEPLVLLADEPAAHLDSASAREIADILQRENLRGMTILIGTSDEQFASNFPKTCIVAFPAARIGSEH